MADAFLRQNPSYRTLSKSRLAQVMTRGDTAPFRNRREFDAWFDSDDPTAQKLPAQLEQTGGGRRKKSKKGSGLKIAYPSYSFQIDVVVMQMAPISKRDRFLLLVEMNSKKAFATVLASNGADEVTDAYESLLEKEVLPEIPLFDDEDDSKEGMLSHVHVVMGDAFFANRSFRELNRELGILMNTSVAANDHLSSTGDALGIVDSTVRTLKSMFRRKAIDLGAEPSRSTTSYDWPRYLDDIIDAYNALPHGSVKNKMTPDEMYADRVVLAELWREKSRSNAAVRSRQTKLAIGSKVRLLVKKTSAILKGPSVTLSPEVYTISGYTGTSRYLLDELPGRKPRFGDVVAVKSKEPVNFRTTEQRPSNRNVALRRELQIDPSSGPQQQQQAQVATATVRKTRSRTSKLVRKTSKPRRVDAQPPDMRLDLMEDD